MTDIPGIAEIAGKLTRAQRRAVGEGQHGYCDDNTLTGSERRMLYRLEDAGFFFRPIGKYSARRPDLELTPLGLAVRNYLREKSASTPEGDHP